ncbi:MAG TPA: hypothetical protein VNC39_12265 [Acidocella sp.]|uniref:hypothetical protein n=1 Tax=Acidocella sp. TaxID=50710 RepID=UPI002C7B8557|nr:hypothetical protein [Acidocella sp.]HVE22742.1 hypothetical protein [Acidocella sp.]
MNKKQQKNFITLGRSGFAAPGPAQPKVFAPLFSKSGRFLYASSLRTPRQQYSSSRPFEERAANGPE